MMSTITEVSDAINERVIRIQSHFDGGETLNNNAVQNLQRLIGRDLAEICRQYEGLAVKCKKFEIF
jgi:hypothetical protein